MRTALHQILSQETVDSTDYIKISDLDSPPVITFCPRQIDIYKKDLGEWGYWFARDLMAGQYLNLTFSFS